ncbi:MAG: caspase family protein [Cyanobacteriota bacterium]|nr:caspase family protein [Cyanobacteriota bacterium]
MNRQALVVGINLYPQLKDSSNRPKNLRKPAADAEAIAQLLETYGNFQVTRFPAIEIDDSLQIDATPKSTNAQTTALKEAISNLFNPENNIPDTALLFFAGRGLQEEIGGVTESFLAASDANLEKGKLGVSLNWLARLLEKSRARQQIVWLDCCDSEALLQLSLEKKATFSETDSDRCSIVAGVPRDSIIENNEEHSPFTNSLLEALSPENNLNRCATNYSLVDHLKKQFTTSKERPLFNNSGSEIILTGELENLEIGVGIRGICPYKGLASYECNQIDPKYFYGRKKLTNLLLEKVRTSNFLAVIGSRGSGKSSAVNAGLLHQLKLGQRISGSEGWPIVKFRPGEHPLKSLAVALADYRSEIAASGGAVRAKAPEWFESVAAMPARRPPGRGNNKRSRPIAGPPPLPHNLFSGAISTLEGQNPNSKPRTAKKRSPSESLPIPPPSNKQPLPGKTNGSTNGYSSKTDVEARGKPEVENYALVKELLIKEGGVGLRKLLQTPKASRVVLVVERLEEVFSLCEDVRERQQFFECLMGAVEPWLLATSLLSGEQPTADRHTSVLVIVTMRADFFGKCALQQYGGLAEQIQSQMVTVMPMTREELKEVITEPARQVGIEVEPELVERTIEDVQKYGSLPLLQYALTELWRRRSADRFTVSEYERIGGIKGCLEKRANEVYQSLTKKERQIARSILLASIQIGLETEDVTRPVWKKDLVTRESSRTGPEGFSVVEISKVLQKLTAARLVVTSKARVTPESNKTATLVELARESTIRYWSKLHSWVESRRDAMRRWERLEADAQEWQNNRRAKDYLLVGLKLSALKNAMAGEGDEISLSPLGREFIATSIQQQRHRQWRNYGMAAVAIAFLLGFLGVAVYNWRQAQWQRLSLESQKLKAQVDAWSWSSQKLFAEEEKFDALLEALKAGKLLKEAREKVPSDTSVRAIASLQKAVYGIRSRRTLAEHLKPVNSVSFSPDGKAIASASDDGTVKVWTSYGEEILTLSGHVGPVYSVSFSPTGDIIASAGNDGTVKLWDKSGYELLTLVGRSGAVNSLSFSGSGDIIASAGNDGTVKLWDLEGKEILSIPAHKDKIYSVSLSQDGKTIASASEDNTVKLWDIKGREIATLEGHRDRAFGVSFSPDGKTLASASWDNTIKVWNVEGREIGTLRGHDGPAIAVRFSPDGKTIASASADGIIKLWTRYGREIATLKGHSALVGDLSFSPDGKTIASASADFSIKLWNLSEAKLPTLEGHQSVVRGVSFSPMGQAIATASFDGTIKIWTPDGKELRTLTGHTRGVYSVSFSPNGTVVASAGADGTVKLWNIDDGSALTLIGHRGEVNSVSFSSDGKVVASAGADRTVKLWNLKGQELVSFTRHKYGVRSVSLSPDAQTIASAGYGGEGDNLILWNLNGEVIVGVNDLCLAVNSVSFSPSGDKLVVACSNNTVKLIGIDGKVLATFKGHKEEVYSAIFSPDGKTVASGSADGTIKIWSLEGEELATLLGHGDGVYALSFSPDGNILVSGSWDFTAMLWYFDLDYLLARGCDLVYDYLQKSPNIKEGDRDLCQGL